MSETTDKPRCQICNVPAEVVTHGTSPQGMRAGFFLCRDCMPQVREVLVEGGWRQIETKILGTK